MDPALLHLILAMAGRSARQGTLVEIVETLAKLVRLLEPLLNPKPDAASGQ